MTTQTKPALALPSYARSIKTTVSMPAFLFDDGVAKMRTQKIFKFSKYVQRLIEQDVKRP